MIITHGDSYQRAWECAKISRKEQYLRTRTELLGDLYSEEDLKWQLDSLELSENQITFYLAHGIINEDVKKILLELNREHEKNQKYTSKIEPVNSLVKG